VGNAFEDKSIMSRIIWLGAVAYDPKVVTIWEGMRRYFHEESRLPVEVLLFQSYEKQVSALLAAPGDPTPRIDIAWNTNLAYLQADTWSDHRCRPIAMRDTDIGWETKIVAVTGGQVATLADLSNRTLALGSRDSGHAAILPVYFLERGKCQAQLKIVANRRRCWFSLSKARRTAAKDSTSGKMSGVTSISASVAPTGCQ
jgi:ABC-type phosphate/phosphonate transport system substrate-binding protein